MLKDIVRSILRQDTAPASSRPQSSSVPLDEPHVARAHFPQDDSNDTPRANLRVPSSTSVQVSDDDDDEASRPPHVDDLLPPIADFDHDYFLHTLTHLPAFQRDMVLGIREILIQVEDDDNRRRIVKDQVRKFSKEGIHFDYREFGFACGCRI